MHNVYYPNVEYSRMIRYKRVADPVHGYLKSKKNQSMKERTNTKNFLYLAGDPPGMDQSEREVNRERIRSLLDDEADRTRFGFGLGASVGAGPAPPQASAVIRISSRRLPHQAGRMRISSGKSYLS
jgi:hypothetical protein